MLLEEKHKRRSQSGEEKMWLVLGEEGCGLCLERNLFATVCLLITSKDQLSLTQTNCGHKMVL